MSTFYIASRGAAFFFSPLSHVYLVRDDDGSLSTTTDQFIIRGGPEFDNLSNFGVLKMELGESIQTSEDFLDSVTPGARNYTQINLTEAQWGSIIAYGDSFSTQISGTNKFLSDVNYYMGGPNSNSIITSLLSTVGLNVYDTLPVATELLSPGLDHIFVSGPDAKTISVGSQIHSVIDRGTGATSIALDGNSFSGSGQAYGNLKLHADGSASSIDKLIFLNISPTSLTFLKSSDGDLNIFLPGDIVPSISLKGQFSGAGKFDSLEVGSTTISLTDPNSFNLGEVIAVGPFAALLKLAFDYSLALAQYSPLVLDLDGDGIELTSLSGAGASPVYWDMDSDGIGEASAWVKADDGLLVRDVNGNGKIDSQSELFGTLATDGFTALRELDSNTDGQITSTDTGYGGLKIWRDLNQDGVSQDGELQTLTSLGISSISLNSAAVNYQLAGNQISHDSTFVMNGATRTVVDAWFKYDGMNTAYRGTYTLNPDTLLLPEMRGYGDLPNLTIAMSQKPALLAKVKQITELDILSTPVVIASLVKEALHLWAGVENVDPAIRGTASGWQTVDGRDIAFLEKMLDQKFAPNSTDWLSGPRGTIAEDMFREFATAATARLLLQSSGAQFFTTPPAYDAVADTYSGPFSINMTAINNALAGKEFSDVVATWSNILSMLVGSVGLANIDSSTRASISTAINNSDPNHVLTFESFVSQTPNYNYVFPLILGASAEDTRDPGLGLVMGVGGFDLHNGTVSDDAISLYSLIGSSFKDQIVLAGAGNDTITGAYGNDTIFGQDGNDRFESLHLGINKLYGGAGDDLFLLNGNTDKQSGGVVDGGTGTNKLVATGILTGISISNIQELEIASSTTMTAAQLVGVTTLTTTSGGVANLYASAAGSYDISSKAASAYIIHMHGTSGNDVLTGNGSDQTLNGDLGNDTLTGNGGADTIYGGDGNDVLTGGSGADAIYGGAGDDRILSGGSEIASGEIIDGGVGTGDIIETWGGNLSLATISNVEQLGLNTNDVTLSAAQLAAFGTLTRFGGGAGNLYASAAGTYDLSAKTVTSGIFNLYGSTGNDTLIGNSAGQTLSGADGDDWLTGLGGADSVYGGNGNDRFFSGGSEVASGEIIDGGAGTDTIEVWGGNLSLATMTSIEGLAMNTSSITMSASQLAGMTTLTRNGGGSADIQASGTGTYSLETKTITSGTFSLYGSTGNDTLIGNSSGQALSGGDGDDWITGLGGADSLYGGNGNDRFFSGGSEVASGEIIDGGAGTDTVEVWGGNLSLATMTSIEGLAMNTSSITMSASQLAGLTSLTRNGGGSADIQASAAGTYSLAGKTITSGTFNLIGSSGDDTLTGTTGTQTLNGDGGNDALNGGSGADTLTGGAGNDIFYFSAGYGADTVTDMNTSGDDTINLAGSGLANYAAVQSIMTQSGADVLVTLNGTDSLLIKNTTLAQLQSSDFAFA